MSPIFFYWIVVLSIMLWAGSWNQSVFLTLVVSVLLTPIGGILFVLLQGRRPNPTENHRKPCMNCAELIRLRAKVCRFCGSKAF